MAVLTSGCLRREAARLQGARWVWGPTSWITALREASLARIPARRRLRRMLSRRRGTALVALDRVGRSAGVAEVVTRSAFVLFTMRIFV